MVVYEKIYFKAYTKDHTTSCKNNIAQLYFILGRAELRWNFSSWLKDAPDIYRFPTVYVVKIHFLLENLWMSVRIDWYAQNTPNLLKFLQGVTATKQPATYSIQCFLFSWSKSSKRVDRLQANDTGKDWTTGDSCGGKND